MDKTVPPPGWGQDRFTKYLDEVRENQFATFVHKRSEVSDLASIDKMFRKLFEDAVNPRPFIPVSFILRAHSAFLSAAAAVLAGQAVEAQALLRVCLEQGGYAYFIGNDDARYERWMGRNTSQKAKQLVRDEFKQGQIIRHLKSAAPEIGKLYETLYDRTIDTGAHPNAMGTLLSSAVENQKDGGVQFTTIYQHADGVPLVYGLRSSAQVGLCVMLIARLIYPSRVKAVGIDQQLDGMLRRY